MPGDVIQGLEIIRFLAEQTSPQTVKEITDALGLNRASVYRILHDLCDSGWVDTEGRPMRFSASLRVGQLGASVLKKNAVREILIPHAIDLSRETGRPCGIAFYYRGDILWTDGVDVLRGRVRTFLRSDRAPAASVASGKILLAHQPEAERKAVIARGLPPLARNTRTDPADIAKDIEETRMRGYGFSESEYLERSAGLAVPVFDAQGRAVAAMSVWADVPVSPSFIEEMLPIAQSIAAAASAELGFRRGVYSG